MNFCVHVSPSGSFYSDYCLSVWVPLWPAAPPEQLFIGRKTKRRTGRAQFCSTVYLKHTSPHGLPGDTNNPLVSAHHPRKSPLQITSGHTADHLLTFWCSMRLCYSLHQADPNVLIWLVLGSPLGSPAPPAPPLSRFVICVIPLALIPCSPGGFSSHMAQQMPHV